MMTRPVKRVSMITEPSKLDDITSPKMGDVVFCSGNGSVYMYSSRWVEVGVQPSKLGTEEWSQSPLVVNESLYFKIYNKYGRNNI